MKSPHMEPTTNREGIDMGTAYLERVSGTCPDGHWEAWTYSDGQRINLAVSASCFYAAEAGMSLCRDLEHAGFRVVMVA